MVGPCEQRLQSNHPVRHAPGLQTGRREQSLQLLYNTANLFMNAGYVSQ